MKRRYRIDDCDYEQYILDGGTETRAQFFNRMLAGGGSFSDAAPLTRRVASSCGIEQTPASLTERLLMAI